MNVHYICMHREYSIKSIKHDTLKLMISIVADYVCLKLTTFLIISKVIYILHKPELKLSGTLLCRK